MTTYVASPSGRLVRTWTGNTNARKRREDLRVVVRLYDPEFAVRVQQGFKIRFTRSVSQLAAPAFAAAAVGSEVIASVADPGSDAARWSVPDDEVLDAGEEVVVAATRAGLGQLLQLAATRQEPPRPPAIDAPDAS